MAKAAGSAEPFDPDDNPALALHWDEEWSDLVEKDITELEGKTELFLARASALYDLLLNHGEGVEPTRAAVDGALDGALSAYRELGASAEVLARHLERADVRTSMHDDPSFAEQYEKVTALMAAYRALPPLTAAHYDLQDQRPLTSIFQVKVDGELTSSALSKPQRDALMLLDWLQQLGHEMSFVSTAVTAWVAIRRENQPAHNLTMDMLAH